MSGTKKSDTGKLKEDESDSAKSTSKKSERKGRVTRSLFYLYGDLSEYVGSVVSAEPLKDLIKLAAKKGDLCYWNEEIEFWMMCDKHESIPAEYVEEIFETAK